MTQRVCPFCGASIPRVARTCAICGHEMPEQELSTAPPPTPVATANTPLPPATDSWIVGHDEDDSPPTAYYPRPTAWDTPTRETAPSAAIVETELTQDAPDPDATEKETELVGMVGVYAVVGGYSGALVGLFMPLMVVLAIMFDPKPEMFEKVLIGIIGAIIWIPLSVIIAIVMGIGGLVLGLGVGIAAAILFRLTINRPEAYKTVRVLVAGLNMAVFGYAASRFYSRILGETFPEFVALPIIIGLIGALAGLVMGLAGPEKLQEESEPMNDEELEEAKGIILAPFRFWRKVAGVTGATSVDILDKSVRGPK